jgi:L-lysine 6-transaminase
MPDRIPAVKVRETVRRHLLADGLELVPDLDRSRGVDLVDARTGETFLDYFTCFSTLPLGWNHPKLADRAFREELARVAVQKPSNSDFYTMEMAAFVEAFGREMVPAGYRHLFFIDGGALAVENALKAAFDWKVKKNRAAGQTGEVGTQVLHFRDAFHGRSGYTLSLTNTADPRKYALFPKFRWPRVSAPDSPEGEGRTLEEIESAFAAHGDDIAAILVEPIQCEGGDRHFRGEFLRALRETATRHGGLLVFDEVQTGFFATGKRWCFEHFGVEPDLVAFGKKSQICGVFAGTRIDEVPDNVFRESSRINSTWGGNLVDMVRCRRVLEIVREENLAENARRLGEALVAGLRELAREFPRRFSNPRGRGVIVAFDLPTTAQRDATLRRLYEGRLLALACGRVSIRFRPALDAPVESAARALGILSDVFRRTEPEPIVRNS